MELSDDNIRDLAAIAAMVNLSNYIDWQDAVDPALAKHVATQAYNIADAMLDESRMRRESDRNQKIDDPKNWPLRKLYFSPRVMYALERLGCTILEDVTIFSEEDLLGERNFGDTMLKQVKDKLAEHGLSLSEKNRISRI